MLRLWSWSRHDCILYSFCLFSKPYFYFYFYIACDNNPRSLGTHILHLFRVEFLQVSPVNVRRNWKLKQVSENRNCIHWIYLIYNKCIQKQKLSQEPKSVASLAQILSSPKLFDYDYLLLVFINFNFKSLNWILQKTKYILCVSLF